MHNVTPTKPRSRLAIARFQHGCTLAELAGLAGCSLSTISRVERAERTATPALRAFLAAYFGEDLLPPLGTRP
jgi:transcriptional regulator with XRE-family HTH domain